ncbi:hypothetical protein GW17_00015464 [Ensete ventricosum]|uniref:Uncharacterized protein n=1 Tax=Ensete ventricosum TaxID=4639 RepID=A0A426Z0H4_ENSVE|nr:hypothetical protein B296_00025201 [Ensete ventricosum]RWW20429.1 hypothetical protein GW17_00015464 [Ensete ventricosum]RZR76563.1 hypothetical protein BHM03_00001419 [Ensete ventricosum]
MMQTSVVGATLFDRHSKPKSPRFSCANEKKMAVTSVSCKRQYVPRLFPRRSCDGDRPKFLRSFSLRRQP